MNLTSNQVRELDKLCVEQSFTNVRVQNTNNGIIVESNPVQYLGMMTRRYYRILGNGETTELKRYDVGWMF